MNTDKKPDPSFSGAIEDRTEERHSVDLTVTVNSDHNFYAGFARNLSAHGIFVATHFVHPVGTKFDLSIHMDDDNPKVVRGVGEVRWTRSSDADGEMLAGIGIRFLEIYDDGTERIERFLARRGPMDEPEQG